jgi:hypothetical protein
MKVTDGNAEYFNPSLGICCDADAVTLGQKVRWRIVVVTPRSVAFAEVEGGEL